MTLSRIIRPADRRRVAALVACGLSYACGADGASAPQNDDAARAANVFRQLSDSIAKAGGDTSIAGAYASLGDAIRKGFRVSPVTIVVDGAPLTFMATAQALTVIPPCPEYCTLSLPAPLRTFVAWLPSDPRRVLQVSSLTDLDTIRAYVSPTIAPFPGRAASLVYFDGTGGTFFGTSGTQRFFVTTSDTPCVSLLSVQIFPPPPTCANADFRIDFSAKAEPSTFLAGKNTATGSHTFAMTTQAVAGVSLVVTAALPPVPPITVLPRAMLGATLGVKVDSIATLTLTVSNDGNIPQEVRFNSGQHSDFSVYDNTTGARVWNSSMGILFTQIVSVDTVPAKAQRVFTAYWVPARKGTFTAAASLVSASHSADAKATFTVP